MQVQLFSKSMLYEDALKGYQSPSTKHYVTNESPYKAISNLYIKALRMQNKQFVDIHVAKTVIGTYYKTARKKDRENNPENIASIASAIATQYNQKAMPYGAKGILPNFKNLEEKIVWITKIMTKLAQGNIMFRLAYQVANNVSASMGNDVGNYLSSPVIRQFGSLDNLITAEAFGKLGLDPSANNSISILPDVARREIFGGIVDQIDNAMIALILLQATPWVVGGGIKLIKGLRKWKKDADRSKLAGKLLENTDMYVGVQKALEIIDEYEKKGKPIPKKKRQKVAKYLEASGKSMKNMKKATEELNEAMTQINNDIKKSAKIAEKELEKKAAEVKSFSNYR